MSCAAKAPPISIRTPFDGHQLQLEFLTDAAIISAILGKSSGRLALEFTLADIADIATIMKPKICSVSMPSA
jgi:hypothetical protein